MTRPDIIRAGQLVRPLQPHLTILVVALDPLAICFLLQVSEHYAVHGLTCALVHAYSDSIDLQERQAPSAQEHSRSTPPPTGSLAPHQAETLREVKAEAAEEHLRSPRVSWSNGDASDLQQYVDDLSAGLANPLGIQQQEAGHRDQNGETGAGSAMAVGGQQQDALAIAQNGGVSGHRVREGDINGDAEGDDGMDDDMMDKISSSPSIEDGGSPCSLPRIYPQRSDSLHHEPFVRSLPSSPASPPVSDARSSSPYIEGAEYAPWQALRPWLTAVPPRSPTRRHCHLQGEYHAQRQPSAFPDESPPSAP